MPASTPASPFTPDELERIGGAEEVQLSSVRPDGTDCRS